MRIETDVKLNFNDVLIRPKRSSLSSRSEVSLERTFKFSRTENAQWTGIPIIAANMDSIGTLEMAKTLGSRGLCTALHKFYSPAELSQFFYLSNISQNVFYTLGTTEKDLYKFVQFAAAMIRLGGKLPAVCIDVANGYTESFVKFVSAFKSDFPECVVMAGNVVTGEMTEELILNGVDIVKVGLGSGSACLTRSVTGVGYPQLSAIIECADAAHGLGGLICADGGCRTSGDIAKAFGGGADFVMLGGMLAGHDECGKEFYGMSSRRAMEKHYGKMAEYRASEGAVVETPARGPVINTVNEILGGLRSTCTYVGAPSLRHLSKCTTFIRVGS